MSLLLIFCVVVFFLGTIMGSFSGVILERGRGGFDWKRLPEIFLGRSYCPGCVEKSKKSKIGDKNSDIKQLQKKYTLKWRQLIPLFGWLIQGGRCYRCKSKIPAWYMGYEILMGLAFVLTALMLPGFSVEAVILNIDSGAIQLLFWLLVTRAGVGLFVADILRYELNIWLWLFMLIWVLGGTLMTGVFFFQGLVWFLVLTSLFVAIYLFGKRYVKIKFGTEGEGFGQGDVMVAMVVGLLFPFVVGDLGWISGVQLVMLYLIVSSILGMVFRGIRVLLSKNTEQMIPFLPAMIVGFVVLLIYGDALVGILG